MYCIVLYCIVSYCILYPTEMKLQYLLGFGGALEAPREAPGAASGDPGGTLGIP